jgi:2-polyprenyl-6-methoxyphenol hydroxylase-like FAD-dependent oxidoreductase
MRRLLGVGAQMTDFGRSVIVCRMRHTLPHEDIAHECFGYERTLAILPLQPDPDTGELLCSAVITTDSADAQRLLQLSPEDFAAHVQHDFQDRLGRWSWWANATATRWWPPMPTASAAHAGRCWAMPPWACTR